MLLAEQLLLMALDPEKGRPPLGKKDALEVGLCGALVSELALRPVVTVTNGRAVVLDARPTGSDLLDDVVGLLDEDGKRGRTLKRQLKAVHRGLGDVVGRVARPLVAASVLTEESSRVAGIFPATRYPVTAPDERRRIRDQIRTWLGPDGAGAAPLEPSTACLVALLGASQLLGTVTDGVAERRRASARAKAAMEHAPAARAVKAIIDEVVIVSGS